VRCATAVLEDRPVGISVAVGGANAAGWLGGVLREHQHTSANAALVWDALTWAHADGCGWLDMLGAPDPGIAAYKRKFKPRVLEHPVGSWRAPGFALAQKAQRALASGMDR
jgi:lipid II:glycine glycyltransferase (peptidoglycan interpeptide bridge formation enzyme)